MGVSAIEPDLGTAVGGSEGAGVGAGCGGCRPDAAPGWLRPSAGGAAMTPRMVRDWCVLLVPDWAWLLLPWRPLARLLLAVEAKPGVADGAALGPCVSGLVVCSCNICNPAIGEWLGC